MKKKKPIIRKKTSSQNKISKPIGKITHYFTKIKVGIIKFKTPFKVGKEIQIKGVTTDFKMEVEKMQYNHQEIKTAKKNQLIGIKVKRRVREGDEVFLFK